MRMPDDPWIKALAMGLSLAWGFGEQFFAIRNRRKNGRADREKDKGSFLWISISISIGMTIACVFAFSGHAALQHPHRWELAGLLVMLAGAGIRIHAIRILAQHFTSRVTLLEDHALIREGAYRNIRHPSYLGQILILVGLGALMANSVSLVAAPLFTIAALLLRIRVEERAMAEHFGQAYEDYRRATWRLLPPIW
jgi:protein-S-isoprenylcysteine O-methyltransferase Ste14